MKYLPLMLGMIVLISGCTAYQTTPATTTPTTPLPPGAREIVIEASSYNFNPSTITVTNGEIIRFKVISKDAYHTFTVDELGIDIAVQAGQTVTKDVTIDKSGTFTLYCKPHRGLGMIGTMQST